MSNNIDYNALHKHIVKMAQKVVADAPLQVVRTGVIKEILPNEYYIQLADSSEVTTVRAEAMSKEENYKIDDLVYLLMAPSVGGASNQVKYFIFGLVSVTDQSYYAMSDLERAQINGEALATIKGTTYESNTEQSLVTYELGGDGNDVIVAIKMNRTFGVSAYFTTGLLADEISYGLKFRFYDKNGNQIETVTFGDEHFIGQPFAFNNSKQEIIISLKDGAAKDLSKLEVIAFCEGEIRQQKVDTEVTVKDITLVGGNLQDFLNNLTVTAQIEGKNYFNKDAATDEKIILKAVAKYRSQELHSTTLRYYWFIKDERVANSESAGYNPIMGSGWYCLNSSEKVAVAAYQGTNETKEITLWDAKSDTITIEDRDRLNLYENEIKCVVGYQLSYIKSKDGLYIYDLNKEAWSATLESDNATNTLFVPSEKIKLTCKVVNENIINQNPDLIYKWIINNIANEDLDQSIIYVKDSDTNSGNTNDTLELSEATKEINICCKVSLKNEDGSKTEIATTNLINIKSVVDKGNNYQEIQQFKYFISKQMAVDYKSIKSTETNASGQELVVNDWEILGAAGTWVDRIKDPQNEDRFVQKSDIFIFEDITNSGIAAIEQVCVGPPAHLEGEYYLHVSSRQVIANITDEKIGSLASVSDWEEPYLARHFYWIPKGGTISSNIIKDLKSFEEIKQLNTFNKLTNNGRAQGLFYENGEAFIQTSDWDPDNNINKFNIKTNYYYKKAIYTPFIEGPISANQKRDYYFYPTEQEGTTINYISADFDTDTEDTTKFKFKTDYTYYIQDKEDSTIFVPVNLLIPGIGLDEEKQYYVWKDNPDEGEIKGYNPWENKEGQPYDPSQIYYTKSLANEYILFTGRSFEKGITYYERAAETGDLYINATFINTGTLRVGSDDTERFYASIDNSEVKIAGFQVSENTIESTDFMGEDGIGQLIEDGIFIWDVNAVFENKE